MSDTKPLYHSVYAAAGRQKITHPDLKNQIAEVESPRESAVFKKKQRSVEFTKAGFFFLDVSRALSGADSVHIVQARWIGHRK